MTPDEYMAKARRSQESAHLLLDAEDLVGAVNRAYYAMFYAAHASLTHAGIEVPSAKHGTLISRFGQHLVKSGRVPDHFGRWLNRALELRSTSDYGDVPPDQREAQEAIARAQAFLEAIDKLLATSPSVTPRGRRA
jgi:uncharacterized protein (UPF0332 family)